MVLNVLKMLCGLAFFLYGMNVMSSSLEKMAGGRLESTLRKATSKPLLGFGLGVGITIAMQSSSAMTVMLVGLVNSGIMDFRSAVAPILGSNVGTTFTAWILSLMGVEGDGFSPILLLSPPYLAAIVAFLGIVLMLMSKDSKKKEIGIIMVGFGILMYGMEFMGDSVDSIKNLDPAAFQQFVDLFKNPIVGLLISTLFTGVIQSSAATVGIVQTLALSGGISYEMAIPLVLGANIGTCVTALISSFGANIYAKRVVGIHFYVNVVGSILCMIIMYILMPIVPQLDYEVTPFTVCLIHTFFNIFNCVYVGLSSKFMLKVIIKILPDKKGKKQKSVFLDERLLNTPQMAIEECCRLGNEMAVFAREAVEKSIALIENYSEEGFEEVANLENLTDRYEDKLGTFLVRLSGRNLSSDDSHVIGRMLHTIGDLERMGDHAENISQVAKELYDKKISFSSHAKEELKVITDAVKEILQITTVSFVNNDIELSKHVEPLEEVIDTIRTEIQQRHIERVQKGECTVELGFVLSDLITNYERISDHCSNIAVYTIQMHSKVLDAHKYLRGVRAGKSEEFVADYNRYEEKYILPANQ